MSWKKISKTEFKEALYRQKIIILGSYMGQADYKIIKDFIDVQIARQDKIMSFKCTDITDDLIFEGNGFVIKNPKHQMVMPIKDNRQQKVRVFQDSVNKRVFLLVEQCFNAVKNTPIYIIK